MAKKIKNSRSFTFKAYEVSNCEILTNSHVGEFMFKSECHYYCEKYILDFINNNWQTLDKSKKFVIYKISTLEDTKIEDMLIETISIKEDKINID